MTERAEENTQPRGATPTRPIGREMDKRTSQGTIEFVPGQGLVYRYISNDIRPSSLALTTENSTLRRYVGVQLPRHPNIHVRLPIWIAFWHANGIDS